MVLSALIYVLWYNKQKNVRGLSLTKSIPKKINKNKKHVFFFKI